MGTHFATRVPTYQYPAGTCLSGVACYAGNISITRWYQGIRIPVYSSTALEIGYLLSILLLPAQISREVILTTHHKLGMTTKRIMIYYHRAGAIEIWGGGGHIIKPPLKAGGWEGCVIKLCYMKFTFHFNSVPIHGTW